MGEEIDKEIEKIEQTQDALRESIEQAKQLSEKAQKLLRQHKRNLKKQPE